MDTTHLPKVDHDQLEDLILKIGHRRTLMVWGSPGIGKSERIEKIGRDLSLPTHVLLGSQMSPEDLGVPLINPETGTTRLCPPESLVGSGGPQLILIDELNNAEADVSRAFFSLINERRIGSFTLHPESIVVAAGNPPGDNSSARPLVAPLMNRMLHVELKLRSTRGWLTWAEESGVHRLIREYIAEAGLTALVGRVGGDDEIFTSPRSWAIASDSLEAFGVHEEELSTDLVNVATAAVSGAVARKDAELFRAYLTRLASGSNLSAVLRGEAELPDPADPQNRLAISSLIDLLAGRLASELPSQEGALSASSSKLVTQAQRLISQVAATSPELMHKLLSHTGVPSWFLDRVSTTVAGHLN